MALNSNALTTVNNLFAYMGESLVNPETFSIYHNAGASSTAATVQIGSDTLTLIVTGGTNAGAGALTLSDYATTTLLVAAVNALAKGWVAAALRSGSEDPSDLDDLAQTSAWGAAAVKYPTGRDVVKQELAINAASAKIESYTGRIFNSTTFTHMYSGKNLKELQLRYFPLIQVHRVAIGRREAFKVKNTATGAIQANFAIEPTQLTLDVIGGTSAHSDTIAYTDDTTTLTTVVASINALSAYGWEAEVETSADGGWCISDCFEYQPRDAYNSWLTSFTPYETEDRYDTNLETGTLFRTGWGKTGAPVAFVTGGLTGRSARPHELRPITADSAGPFWPEGMFNVYVKFTAGFATIPTDLENICLELAKNIILNAARNTALTGENIDGYSWTSGFTGATGRSGGEGALTSAIRLELEQWRMYFIPEYVQV